jgi:phage baseplate assembly protein W
VATVEAGEVFGRGIGFPPRVGPDGRVAWSEGEDNVREGIEIVLKTEPGERLQLPDFGGGLASQLFEPNTTATRQQLADRIARALAAWEPRVAVESIQVDPDPTDPSAATATVAYRLVATQAPDRLRLSLFLGG